MTEYTVEFVGTGETIEVADTETILQPCIEEGSLRSTPAASGCVSPAPRRSSKAR